MTDSAKNPLRFLKSRWAVAAVLLLVVLVGVRRMAASTEVRTVGLEQREIVETLAANPDLIPPELLAEVVG